MHIYFEQGVESYSSAFSENQAKRPDFLVLIKYIGLIAVDVKARTIDEDYQNVFIEEKEVLQLRSFQEISCIPTWIVIMQINATIKNLWYWVNIMDLQKNHVSKNHKTIKKKGYFIPIESCIPIKKSEGISGILQNIR